MSNPLFKTLTLFFSLLIVILASITLVNWMYKGDEKRVHISLMDQQGKQVTTRDLGGKHLIVFFGFSSCLDVCPSQMAKLSHSMAVLDQRGYGNLVTPVFISIDPERDSSDKVASYLKSFDSRFIGLTGSRQDIEQVTKSFKTLLQDFPKNRTDNYQLTHSSVFYIVDPFGRLVNLVPDQASPEAIADLMKKQIKGT